jgi:CubicO group peptidase (beta-lactamase class C family)
VKLRDGAVVRVHDEGDLEVVRPWASVTKMAVALAVGVEVDWDLHAYDEVVGPNGATLAHLLSHSSGLGFEEGERVRDVGERRVYSNVGIDRAVEAIVGAASPAQWLKSRVFDALGMHSSALRGRPCADGFGSTADLALLARAWLRGDGVSDATRERIVTPYLPALAGIVPGFGRFSPCPWGLGPEVRGTKRHWMGDWPEASFGHFGQSGALLLVNLDEGIAVVATTEVPFGPWAVELWPTWTSRVRELALS